MQKPAIVHQNLNPSQPMLRIYYEKLCEFDSKKDNIVNDSRVNSSAQASDIIYVDSTFDAEDAISSRVFINLVEISVNPPTVIQLN